MQDGGVFLITGFPRVDGKAMRKSQRTTRTRCNHEHLIHHTTFVHGRRLGLYLQSVRTGRFEFVEGSSCSAMVEEVVVQLVLAGSGTHSF